MSQRCTINFCRMEVGEGLYVRVRLAGGEDIVRPVCDDHWQALRDIFRPTPKEG